MVAKKVESKNDLKSLLSPAAQAAKAKADAAVKEYEKLVAKERAEIIKQIKALVKDFGIEPKAIFPNLAGSIEAESGGYKYFDPASGKGWSGRGKAPEPFQSIRHDQAKLAKYLVGEKKR